MENDDLIRSLKDANMEKDKMIEAYREDLSAKKATIDWAIRTLKSVVAILEER